MSVGSLFSSHCAIFSEMAQRLMRENPPDSATSSSGPSPPPAAAGASGSRTTGSLAPGSKVCEQSSSDVKPCCFCWLQMISRSLHCCLSVPMQSLDWDGREVQSFRNIDAKKLVPEKPKVSLEGHYQEMKWEKHRIKYCLPLSWSSLDCSGRRIICSLSLM